jgi:hypothetical protein
MPRKYALLLLPVLLLAACSSSGSTASYAVGDTGPAGGKIFYVAPSPFACGTSLAESCTYLEAAPSDIPGTHAWCSDTSTSLGVTATAIGTGMKNTADADVVCTSGAIQEAADYSSSGYSDWFLPSKDELDKLYRQWSGVGMLPPYRYWSSSEDVATSDLNLYFDSGSQFNTSSPGRLRVHPVRAF